ncbi:hypothetical protein [uncultured Brevundimonas sp.]|uniref:hypothetical protein n=1 Tax=uncultured Brevundimonas sp. TaxID=213418 RepID=UPI002609A473|nr:hypothetical protein [uncultured Brevundimonas sp.]
MTTSRWAWAALAAVPAIVCAAPAWAATSTSIVVTSRGETLPRSSIQLFNAETGAQVRMEEEDDDRVAALFLLDGGRYRVVVNGETVREISVSGTGSQSFTIDVPPRLAGPAATPQGLTPADERRIADAMTREDQIFAEWDEKTSLIVHAGVGELDAPTQAGTGFQRPSGGAETFAGRNADTIRMHTLGLVLFPLAYREWLISASGLYGKGDEQGEGSVPAGTGTDTGFVYGDFSLGDSAGVNIGDRGSAWTTNSEVELFNLKFKAVQAATGPVALFLFADYLRSRRQYDSEVMAEVFGETLSQARNQEVTDNLIGAGAGLQFDSGPGDGVRFGGWTSAGLFHRSSELSAWERNVCPLCGPEDADFTLRFDETDRGATWSVAAGAYLEVPLSGNVSIGLGADVAYIDEVGAVFNPSSGDQVFLDGETTRLTTTEAISSSIRVGLRARF